MREPEDWWPAVDAETLRCIVEHGPMAPGDLRNLKFETSLLFGGKVGYFFDGRLLGGNVGLEAEAFHFEPNVRQQTARFVGTLGGGPAGPRGPRARAAPPVN